MERKGLKNKGKTFTFQAPLSFKLGSTFFILKMMTKHSTQSRNFNEHKRRKKKRTSVSQLENMEPSFMPCLFIENNRRVASDAILKMDGRSAE